MSDQTMAAIVAASKERKPWSPEIMEALKAPFAEDELTEGSDGFTYPTYEAITRRLDEVFEGCWSAPVTHQEVLGTTTPFAVVRRALLIHHPEWMPRCVENFGGRRVTRDSNNKFTHLDKDFKSAATMALRKDCLDIGMGMYLTAGKSADEDGKRSRGKSSANQHEFIRDLLAKKGLPDEPVEAMASLYPTWESASARIDELKALPNASKAATTTAPRKAEEKPSEAGAKSPAKQPKAAAGGGKAGGGGKAKAPKPEVGGPDRAALMEEAREFVAGVVKDDAWSRKVSDLMVSIFTRQLGIKVASPDDASAADLQRLLDYFNTPDEDE